MLQGWNLIESKKGSKLALKSRSDSVLSKQTLVISKSGQLILHIGTNHL
jgi:hypothetical protein